MANNNNIYKMSNAGGIKSLTRYYDMLAGNTTWVPFPYNAYDSIATVIVGSGGSSSISFTSIPSTYTHLELRVIAQSAIGSGSGGGQYFMNFNSDTGTNYTRHDLVGDGTSASSAGFATGTYNYVPIQRGYYTASASNIFSGHIVSILDYTNTNKNKTVRNFGGFDANGSGEMYLSSSLWTNTSAITSISITAISSNLFRQYSSFALYGIKGN